MCRRVAILRHKVQMFLAEIAGLFPSIPGGFSHLEVTSLLHTRRISRMQNHGK
jgi:hypothetical protein